jgi:HK97 gp10 family phage protein
MANNARIEVSLTSNNVKDVVAALGDQLEAALETIGIQIENYAKEMCPVDTGLLRNSLTHEVRMDENAVIAGTNVEYAAYVELGTQKTREQPYLRPAIENHMDEYRQIIEEHLQR